jgi:hypothetical protein
MAIARVLPNRQIVLIMSPREASMLEGQILDPSDYPWTDTEAQITSFGIKKSLRELVEDISSMELDKSLDAMHSMAAAQQKEVEEPAEEPQPEPEAPEEEDGTVLRQQSLLRRILGRLGLAQVADDAVSVPGVLHR